MSVTMVKRSQDHKITRGIIASRRSCVGSVLEKLVIGKCVARCFDAFYFLVSKKSSSSLLGYSVLSHLLLPR